MQRLGIPFIQLNEALERVNAALDSKQWKVTFSRGSIDVGWVIVIHPVDDLLNGFGFLGRWDPADFHGYMLDRLTRVVETDRYENERLCLDMAIAKVVQRLTEEAAACLAARKPASEPVAEVTKQASSA